MQFYQLLVYYLNIIHIIFSSISYPFVLFNNFSLSPTYFYYFLIITLLSFLIFTWHIRYYVLLLLNLLLLFVIIEYYLLQLNPTFKKITCKDNLNYLDWKYPEKIFVKKDFSGWLDAAIAWLGDYNFFNNGSIKKILIIYEKQVYVPKLLIKDMQYSEFIHKIRT